ncbi:MAG: M36 family metallopeptidase [Saprospiraceae bacterium]|nr:M36 family metallopeptidase [Saprospiraceae bacterium]
MQHKIYNLLCILLLASVTMSGQSTLETQQATKYISEKAKDWGLVASDYENMSLSSIAKSEKYGLTYLYLNQTINGIDVRNAVAMIVINQKGDVVSSNQTFIQNAAAKITQTAAKIKPAQAVIFAAQQFEIQYRNEPVSLGRSDEGAYKFDMPEFTKSDISAELKYIPSGDKLILTWNLHLDMKQNADYWDYYVNAENGEFVHKHNFTLYCNHHEHAYKNHDNCSNGHFTRLQNSGTLHSENINGSTAARYNVFRVPVESPNHGNRSIATDDEFPEASPFGWHDVDGVPGPEYTITRGNNVYAYQDKDNDNSPDGPDTDGGMNLNFDFPLDFTKDPRESADATVTNLFYMSNMMHDLTYFLGFTEQFGNFQQKNYTGAPGEGDPVVAEAFDGITATPVSLNNANFSIVPDGQRGRMQMFLWNNNSGGALFINEPEALEGFISLYQPAGFGRAIPTIDESPIIAGLIIANDKSNPTEGLGCGEFSNAAQIQGKIPMIDRGICEFGAKSLNAQRAGAVAVIICNVAGIGGGTGDELVGMGAGAVGNQVTIPVVMMRKSDCDRIRISLRNNLNVVMTFQVKDRQGADYFDGSFDNGIIAHEYGHGVSIRLTGGRNQAGCLSNDEQMGEGWSDYFSLIFTHKAGDKGEDARGIGTFAGSQPTNGGGIRTFPYSTDMSINPQTFDDIKGTTAPHPLGAVWTAMLWDMYWAFVNLYGFDPDWTNEESGNFKAALLVMEGMKLQGCNPGFIRGRDAIMEADKLLYNNQHNCMLWETFARRGLGFFANGGDTDNRNDGVQNFESRPTCIEELKITKKATSLVEPGADIEIELRATNHIPERQSKVTVVDELPEGMTYVAGSSDIAPEINGNLLIFNLGDMEYEQFTNITYKAKTTTLNKSTTLAFDNFEGDFEFDIEVNTGIDSWLPIYDVFRSPETSFGIYNLAMVMDASLISRNYQVTGTLPALRFWHQYNTEAGFDGGFVQISVNGGNYVNVPASKYLQNGPNSVIPYSTIAIPALQGFTGNSNGTWVDSYIDLREYIGQTVKFKFRFVSDAENSPQAGDPGWYIDDVELMDLFKYSAQACIFANDNDDLRACTQAVETIINSTSVVKTNDTVIEYFNVSLNPNPASDYFTVNATSPTQENALLTVTSIDGKPVFEGRMNIDQNGSVYTVPTAGIPSGFYFVRLQSGNLSTVKKLIVR